MLVLVVLLIQPVPRANLPMSACGSVDLGEIGSSVRVFECSEKREPLKILYARAQSRVRVYRVYNYIITEPSAGSCVFLRYNTVRYYGIHGM